MIPCLSEATTMASSFADDVAAYADAGWPAMEVWLTKLEDHRQTPRAPSARQLLEERGIIPLAAAFQGGLLLTGAEERRASLDHFQRRLNLCQELGIPTLVIAERFRARPDSATLERVQVSLKQCAQLASAFGVRLAFEFQSGGAWCTSLDTCVGLIAACGEENLGICLDAFHYFTGPSKPEDLGLLTAANLFHVQLCDLAGTPRELASDSDRILPGEGDIGLAPILDHLGAIGYAGGISVELMNPVLWRLGPAQVASAALQALERLLQPPAHRPNRAAAPASDPLG